MCLEYSTINLTGHSGEDVNLLLAQFLLLNLLTAVVWAPPFVLMDEIFVSNLDDL